MNVIKQSCSRFLNVDAIFAGRILPTSFFSSKNGSPTTIFDRNAKYLQRERAAKETNHEVYDYIKEEIGFQLADRIFDMTKEFKTGLDLGCGKGFVAKNLPEDCLSHLHMLEYSPSMLDLAPSPPNISYTKHCVDEEDILPFEDESINIVFSNLSLHWINDLPCTMKEVNRVLTKDGVFVASMFGGETLYELRSALVLAELEREGGFASHISPFTKINDIGALLNHAGFTMLTIDTEDIVIRYPSVLALMLDLKGMAENNSTLNRKLHLYRDTILAADAIYKEMYGGDQEGIPATFEIISMIGWKPDPKKPEHVAKRGSATISIADIARLNELAADQGMEGRLKFVKEWEEKQENLKKDDGDDDVK